LVFEEDRIGCQVQCSARQLDGFNETRRVKIYIDVPNLPDGHTDMVPEPTLLNQRSAIANPQFGTSFCNKNSY
jgi:hypothetical protein